MQAISEPLAIQTLPTTQGLCLITEDGLSCATTVADLLEEKGYSTAILSTAQIQDPVTLAETLGELRQRYGAIVGLIHLAPLTPVQPPENLTQWRQHTQIQAKNLFYLLQGCATDLQQAKPNSALVLSASRLGGYFGRQGITGQGSPAGGAAIGLLKTLITEWPGVVAKAVDFDSSLSPEAISQHIVAELLHPGRLEVGYPQGNRTIFQTVSVPVVADRPPQIIPQADWVIFVTGGAQGITAEITADLIVPGITLVITGRSPYPQPEPPETQGIQDIGALRKIFVGQALAKGLKPLPVQIEAQIQQLNRERAIRDHIDRYCQGGAKVEYLSTDVRSEIEFGAAMERVYQRYGRIDGVIHGAGIIEDKLIVDKTPESFDRVFDTKADSLYLLSRHLRSDSLKFIALFSSVAGRYGNRGQSDYAATNEVMNRYAWQLQAQWPKTRVVAINWGPWDTTGMASEEVKRQFQQRGIVPIPLDSGRQFFLQELAYGQPEDVEVIAGEGPWEAYEAEQAMVQLAESHPEIHRSSSAQATTLDPWLSQFPLLLSQPQLQANGSVLLEHTLTLERDVYLNDHRLDGKPVLPATGALEWIAEFVQAAWPDWVVSSVRDLRVLRGLVLETGAGKTLLLRAKASTHADSESLTVTAELLDPAQKIPFYRATVKLQPQIQESPTMSLLPLNSGDSLDPATCYQNYLFHDQRFQLVSAIERLNQEGIDAQVMPTHPKDWLNPLSGENQGQSRWLFDPGLMDTAPQLAIVWARVQRDTTALPSRLGSVTRYRASREPKPLQLAFRVSHADDHNLTYDAIFFEENGTIHFHLENIESTCNPQLNRLAGMG